LKGGKSFSRFINLYLYLYLIYLYLIIKDVRFPWLVHPSVDFRGWFVRLYVFRLSRRVCFLRSSPPRPGPIRSWQFYSHSYNNRIHHKIHPCSDRLHITRTNACSSRLACIARDLCSILLRRYRVSHHESSPQAPNFPGEQFCREVYKKIVLLLSVAE
jgi:hypothetical protein